MFESIPLLAFITPGWPELIILGVLGVLIFGKRLPEVGKSIGTGIVEFKKGLSGVQEQIDNQSSKSDGDEELEDFEQKGSTFEGSDEEAEVSSSRSLNSSTSSSSS